MFSFFSSKGPFKVKVASTDKEFTVEKGDNLLKAALNNKLAWPHNCRVGSCGECRCRLVSGKIKPLSDFSYVLNSEEMDAGIILACQTSLRSDVEIEVKMDTPAQPISKPETLAGKIVATKSLTHDILEVTVKMDGEFPNYLAGQYAEIIVPGLIDKPRSYSFAKAPNLEKKNHVSFFIRHVPEGEFTTWLHSDNREGQPVSVTGPFGSFWLRDSPNQILCIAGGSGMAPIKALLEQITSQGMNQQVNYLFGARTQKDLYCLDELESIKVMSKGRFNFIPVLSQEPEDSDWTGLRGRCVDEIMTSHDFSSGTNAYLCGPPGMIDSAIEILNKNGLTNENIFYDKFLDASSMKGGRA
jgi:toluene methyl-monooxygenase electron transfer component